MKKRFFSCKVAVCFVIVIFLYNPVFCQEQSNKALLKLTGYEFSLNANQSIPLTYTRSYSSAADSFITEYKIFDPVTGTHVLNITATHYKLQSKIEVIVQEPGGGVLSEINRQSYSDISPSLHEFGVRGDVGVLAGSNVPNQLAIQFVSSKFENVNVINILGSAPGSNDFIFYVLDKPIRVDANLVPKAILKPSIYTGGGRVSGGIVLANGLTGMRIVGTPSLDTFSFSENAKVAVDVKVDSMGIVLDASYQIRGSTTASRDMVKMALTVARRVRFSSGDATRRGTLLINFRVH